MSSTPQLTVIQTAIYDAIGTIVAGTGSYNYTVASRSLDQRDLAEVARNLLPTVDIAFQGETQADEPGSIRCEASWLITGMVAVDAPTAAARGIAARRLRDDIKAAIRNATSLHGTAAIWARFDEYMDDASSPATSDSRGTQASCRFLLKTLHLEPRTLTPPLA